MFYENTFLSEMQTRGYFNDCTNLNKLDNICKNQQILGYIGFDCTASNPIFWKLIANNGFRLMQKYGHEPIVLLGGGTTLIGDPSGKDSTRKNLKKI